MKNVINTFLFVLMAALFLSSCASPTPIMVVVTATPPPATPTQPPPTIEPTPTLVTVPLSGPQDGTTMTWIDGSTLAFIPASEFIMGNGGFDAPQRTVAVDGFWMYRTKVTNRMYAQCVQVGACSPPTEELGGPVYSNPQFANHPIVGINWDQAQAYCSWSQGSLPTEAQWEKAARGTSGNPYPWGADDPGCDLLNLGLCSGRTSEVDAFADGRSPYGLYDMAGNTFEWVADWYGESYYAGAPAENPTGPESGQYRVIRGSSFETDFDQVASAIRHFGAKGYHSRDLGFRCALSEPKLAAPYCQASAYIPTGVIVSDGCELPQPEIAGQYCVVTNSFATIRIPGESIYEVSKNLKCEEATVDGQRILTCRGPKDKETTNEVTVCNPACSNSPGVTGAVPTCDPGYILDAQSGLCNYAPVSGQVNVAGCPVGYILVGQGASQSCVVGKNQNDQCPTGLYFDALAQRCVAPNGVTAAPYGIDNSALAAASYAPCAAGYTYSDTYQCCQAVSGGSYPGCQPGYTFNVDLGACAPTDIRLAGPGCVTLDVTTLQCSSQNSICGQIKNETRCIHTPVCRWNEAQSVCEVRK